MKKVIAVMAVAVLTLLGTISFAGGDSNAEMMSMMKKMPGVEDDSSMVNELDDMMAECKVMMGNMTGGMDKGGAGEGEGQEAHN